MSQYYLQSGDGIGSGWLTIVLHCYDTRLGHMIRKIVAEMTYNVSSGSMGH